MFWFHLCAISSLLDLAFSFRVFHKDPQTRSPGGAPAAVGWLNPRMMSTMWNFEKHRHLITFVLHNSRMQLVRERSDGKKQKPRH